MADDNATYLKLPGVGYRRMVPAWVMVVLFFIIGIFVLLLRGRRVELWLGPDHLLVVEHDGAKEYYRRFHYRDIQAIVVRRTAEWVWLAVALGVALVSFGGLAVSLAPDPSMYFFLGGAVLFAILLVAQLTAGPTCVCQLRTAVQTVDLVSLTRLRHARKMLDQLKPRIEAAQGPLNAVELTAPPQGSAV